MRQRARAKASRHIGFSAASSRRALKLVFGGFASFHQCGTMPQRPAASSSRSEFRGHSQERDRVGGKDVVAARRKDWVVAPPELRNARSSARSSGLTKRPHIDAF